MSRNRYIYSFGYDETESELCKLESKYIFDKEEHNKLLLSHKKIDPSISFFIKRRLDVIFFSTDYSLLIEQIKKADISINGFKVEYLVLDGDKTEYSVRLEKLKDVGYSIKGLPDYYNPTINYGLCYYENTWYFGELIRNNLDWQKHKLKPCSYSNSIGINIAKSLVNIAAQSNTNSRLLDACCGVGTIMLEACFAGIEIDGCDISWKTCKNARENLSHFGYTAIVHCSDIKEISQRYDAAILDLPYNLYTAATDNDIKHIIESAAKISDLLVIVSTTDITPMINNIGYRISDYCSVSKRGKSNFARKIWVCERIK